VQLDDFRLVKRIEPGHVRRPSTAAGFLDIFRPLAEKQWGGAGGGPPRFGQQQRVFDASLTSGADFFISTPRRQACQGAKWLEIYSFSLCELCGTAPLR
jgi:hypothetical protein